ncbi:MAG: HD domain-containing protein [Candidatus Lokiarchaeia archaeon]
MLEEEMLSIVRKYAFNNSEKDDIHGYSHTERVYELSLQIGKKMDANLFILKLSALLHDIGRIKEKTSSFKENHAELSANMALQFLNTTKFEISDNDKHNIFHCIRAHSFSNNIVPETLEAKILSDADKLDALGAIGIYRTIAFTLKKQGGIPQVIEHLENKILKLKDLLHLDITRKMAEDRQQIILDFYNKIKKDK